MNQLHQVNQLDDLLARFALVDLTVTLGADLPSTWPGAMPYRHTVGNWYVAVEDNPQPLPSLGPYHTNWLTIDEHAGTHFDAPPHFIPPPGSGLPHAGALGDQYGDRVQLERLQGALAVVDVRGLRDEAEAGVSPLIDVGHIEAWEEASGSLDGQEAVAFHTGWDEHYQPEPEAASRYTTGPLVTKDSPGWPAPTADAVHYLRSKGVRLLVTDAPSIGACHEPISMHYAGLENGLLYVEGVCGLDRLPARGSYFVFLPLKVARSSGAPGRAIAYIPLTEKGDDD